MNRVLEEISVSAHLMETIMKLQEAHCFFPQDGCFNLQERVFNVIYQNLPYAGACMHVHVVSGHITDSPDIFLKSSPVETGYFKIRTAN